MTQGSKEEYFNQSQMILMWEADEFGYLYENPQIDRLNKFWIPPFYRNVNTGKSEKSEDSMNFCVASIIKGSRQLIYFHAHDLMRLFDQCKYIVDKSEDSGLDISGPIIRVMLHIAESKFILSFNNGNEHSVRFLANLNFLDFSDLKLWRSYVFLEKNLRKVCFSGAIKSLLPAILPLTGVPILDRPIHVMLFGPGDIMNRLQSKIDDPRDMNLTLCSVLSSTATGAYRQAQSLLQSRGIACDELYFPKEFQKNSSAHFPMLLIVYKAYRKIDNKPPVLECSAMDFETPFTCCSEGRSVSLVLGFPGGGRFLGETLGNCAARWVHTLLGIPEQALETLGSGCAKWAKYNLESKGILRVNLRNSAASTYW